MSLSLANKFQVVLDRSNRQFLTVRNVVLSFC